MDSGMPARMGNGGSCLGRWSKLTQPTISLTPPPPRTLKAVRDNGMALYNRISAQEYKECQGDVLAVSEMAEDIRDALLEYQVSCKRPHVAEVVTLKLGRFDRRGSNGQYMTRIAN